jgi:hypothetical protein
LNRTVSCFRATISKSFARRHGVGSGGTEWLPNRRSSLSLADGAGDRLNSVPNRGGVRVPGAPASGARPARSFGRAATDSERRQSSGRLTMVGRKEGK